MENCSNEMNNVVLFFIIDLSLEDSNSSAPLMKSRKLIPSPTNNEIVGAGLIRLKTPGPIKVPTRIAPTKGIKPSFLNTSSPSFAPIRRIPRKARERTVAGMLPNAITNAHSSAPLFDTFEFKHFF